MEEAQESGVLSKPDVPSTKGPSTEERLSLVDKSYAEADLPVKNVKNPLTDPDIMGDVEEAARGLGLSLDKRRSRDRQSHQFWPFLIKTAKQIDTLASSPKWGTMDPKERQSLIVLRTFIRQLIGEKVQPGQYASVAEALAAASGTILGDTTHLAQYREG